MSTFASSPATLPAMISGRDAFGAALLALAEAHPELVVLDADVASSTKTLAFGRKYPERFFNVGVAEANMADIAGGMATCGLRPVVSTFALFLTLKAADQIRNVTCYNNLPVVFAGGYAGLSDSFDGASHQSIADLAIMRALPNMTVVVPCDPSEVQPALAQALRRNGPTYLRLGRNPSPVLFAESPGAYLAVGGLAQKVAGTSVPAKAVEGLKSLPLSLPPHPRPPSTWRCGQPPAAEVGAIRQLRAGNALTMVVCGIPTYMGIAAAERLAAENIDVDLFAVSTLKPLDGATLAASARRTGRVVTIEEHSVIGGLGGAVAEALARLAPVPMEFIGVQDCFTESGDYLALLEKHGLSVEKIAAVARRFVAT